MSVRISNNTMGVFNPATGEDITQISMTTLHDLESILQKAKAASENYNYSSFYRRQNLMAHFQRGIVR